MPTATARRWRSELVLTFAQADIRTFGGSEWSALTDMRDLGFRFGVEDVTDFDYEFTALCAAGFAFVKLDAATLLAGLAAPNGTMAADEVCRNLSELGLTLIVGNIDDEAMRGRVLDAGVPLGQGGSVRSARAGRRRRLCRSGPRSRLRFTRAAARQMPCRRPRPLLTPPSRSSARSRRSPSGTSAWLVDIWGVIHNGVRPFTDACAACARYREGGGIVVLVSNSPRPNDGVAAQLDGIGVPRASWDAIVTSGDVARTLIARYAGRPILSHRTRARSGDTSPGSTSKRVTADGAEAIVCTGLFDDERETPDDYAATLQQCLARGLPMICANPDVMVERGGRMIYCAGAIARAYEALGGKVEYAGKPYAPIYALTFATLEKLKPGSADKAKLLAIGDGVGTDIAGAAEAGVRSVFVASGVHVKGGLDAKAVEALFPPAFAAPHRGHDARSPGNSAASVA